VDVSGKRARKRKGARRTALGPTPTPTAGQTRAEPPPHARLPTTRPEPNQTGGRVLDLGCVPGAWLQVACQEVGPPERYPRARVVGVDIQPPAVPPKYCDWRVRVLEADARAIGPAELLAAAAGGRGGWGDDEEGLLGGEEALGDQEQERVGAVGPAGRRRRGGGGGGGGDPALAPFDAVLSDMLHFTSGAGAVDVARSLELAGTALHAAVGYHYDEAERRAGAEGVAAVAAAAGVARHSGLLRPGGALVVKVYEGSGVDAWLADARGYFDRVVRLRVAASRSMSREFYAVGLGRKPLARGGPPLACHLPLPGQASAAAAAASAAAAGPAGGGGGGPAAAAAAAALPREALQEAQQPARAPRPARASLGGVRRRPGAGGVGGGEVAREPRTPPPAEAPPSDW